jgi:hypothetical protein
MLLSALCRLQHNARRANFRQGLSRRTKDSKRTDCQAFVLFHRYYVLNYCTDYFIVTSQFVLLLGKSIEKRRTCVSSVRGLRSSALLKTRHGWTVSCLDPLFLPLDWESMARWPHTVHKLQYYLQCACYRTSATVLCTVHALQCVAAGLRSCSSIFDLTSRRARHGTVHPCLVLSKAPDLSPGCRVMHVFC